MPDPISDLRAHVDAAHAAADRLVQEANERAAAAENAGVAPDLAAIMALIESIRGVVPDDLSAQLAQALRELLLALRALIDWYIERLEGVGAGAGKPPSQKSVEDIPIS